MPPDLSIAGGEKSPVRGELLWTISTSSTNIVSSPIPSLPSSVESDSSLSSAFSSISVGSISSNSSATEESSEEEDFPPTPPVKALKLGQATAKVLLASSPTSEDESDYFSAKSIQQTKKTFLNKVFPRSRVLDQVKRVSTSSADATWQLALFDEPVDREDSKRILYAKGRDYEGMNLRENLVALLDRADEEHDCDQVVVVLDKKDPNLASILHSLMYVGGLVIPPSATSVHKKHSSKCVLVGIEL